MPDHRSLSPATPDDIAQSLAFALRFSGRKRIHTGDEFMAELMAKHLVNFLEQSGFIIFKGPPATDGAVFTGPR